MWGRGLERAALPRLGVTLAHRIPVRDSRRAWHAMKTDLNAMLKQSGRSSTGAARPPTAKWSRRRRARASRPCCSSALRCSCRASSTSSLGAPRLRGPAQHPHLPAVVCHQPSTPAMRGTTAFYQQAIGVAPDHTGCARRRRVERHSLRRRAITRRRRVVTGPAKSVLPPDTAVPIDWADRQPRILSHVGDSAVGAGREFTDADGRRRPPWSSSSVRRRRRSSGAADDPDRPERCTAMATRGPTRFVGRRRRRAQHVVEPGIACALLLGCGGGVLGR